jgi:hypothetical protein
MRWSPVIASLVTVLGHAPGADAGETPSAAPPTAVLAKLRIVDMTACKNRSAKDAATKCLAELTVDKKPLTFGFAVLPSPEESFFLFTPQCVGADFPASPLPPGCALRLFGKSIEITFGPTALMVQCVRGECAPYDARSRRLTTTKSEGPDHSKTALIERAALGSDETKRPSTGQLLDALSQPNAAARLCYLHLMPSKAPERVEIFTLPILAANFYEGADALPALKIAHAANLPRCTAKTPSGVFDRDFRGYLAQQKSAGTRIVED